MKWSFEFSLPIESSEFELQNEFSKSFCMAQFDPFRLDNLAIWRNLPDILRSDWVSIDWDSANVVALVNESYESFVRLGKSGTIRRWFPNDPWSIGSELAIPGNSNGSCERESSTITADSLII